MEKLYKIGEFARMLSVTPQTVRRWEREGKITAFRSVGDTRYFTHEQYLALSGQSSKSESFPENCVIYARVSTRNQKDDLQNQILFLRQFCNARGMIVSRVYEDYGSGLNYKRKNWNRMLDEVMDRKISTIVVAHKDRFVRFGFDWFDHFCERFGCRIFVVNNETLSPESELVEDIVSILHVFSCRLYGLRKYRKAIDEDKDLREEKE